MENVERLFNQENREKKSIAHGSQKRNRTGKGNVKFPSDYLTKKELNKMNGPVVTCNFNKPTTWNIFLTWNDVMKRDYLNKLRTDYHAGDSQIGKMMGVSAYKVMIERDRVGANADGPHKGTPNKKFLILWNEFLESKSEDESIPNTVPVVANEKKLTVINPVAESMRKNNILIPTSGSLTFTGSAEDILLHVAEMLGNQQLTIKVEWDMK